MGKTEVSGVISSNILSAASLILISYYGEAYSENFSLTKQPLFATKVYTSAIFVMNLVGAWLQGAKPTRSGNAGVSAVLVCSSSIAFHLIAVLFGAPFTSKIPETFHFACLLSAATVLPSFLVLGPHQENWVQVYAQHNPEPGRESNLWVVSFCCVLGAWLGAIPIPLDWDRPWQIWPITCIYGAIYGYIIGLIAGSVYVYLQDKWTEKSKVL